MKRPLLLGHRGSPRVQPENTLESFRAALEVGLDGFELDVQRTLDGVLVTHHDFHLNDGRLIAALRHEELPQHIPTLETVLELAKKADAFVNIEIKLESPNSDGTRTRNGCARAQTGHAGTRHRLELQPPESGTRQTGGFQPRDRVVVRTGFAAMVFERRLDGERVVRQRHSPASQSGHARPRAARARSRVAGQYVDGQRPNHGTAIARDGRGCAHRGCARSVAGCSRRCVIRTG
ncbi:MAG: hypothetical protein HC933_20735 [Pleurocapsa sp. SU_196_0]|nr:hypothetical protein [Pleurocapsa sp. SU_196_0]